MTPEDRELHELNKALTFGKRYGNPVNFDKLTQPLEPAKLLYNVMIQRKERGKLGETKYFTLEAPEQDPFPYIRDHVREKHAGWKLGAFAPAPVPKT